MWKLNKEIGDQPGNSKKAKAGARKQGKEQAFVLSDSSKRVCECFDNGLIEAEGYAHHAAGDTGKNGAQTNEDALENAKQQKKDLRF